MFEKGNPHVFKKGDPRQNGGGRPKAIKEVAALAREHTVDAITALVGIMNDKRATASARVSAANIILERAWGKAPQIIASEDDDGNAIPIKGITVTFVNPPEQPV